MAYGWCWNGALMPHSLLTFWELPLPDLSQMSHALSVDVTRKFLHDFWRMPRQTRLQLSKLLNLLKSHFEQILPSTLSNGKGVAFQHTHYWSAIVVAHRMLTQTNHCQLTIFISKKLATAFCWKWKEAIFNVQFTLSNSHIQSIACAKGASTYHAVIMGNFRCPKDFIFF